jgi:hypothetical protein
MAEIGSWARMAESQARQSMSAFGGLIAGFLVRVQVEEFLKAGYDPAFLYFVL